MAFRPTVYVVDDDAAVRDSLRFLIESVGLTAEVFANASEFLAVADPDMCGCLVADLRLPGGISGLDMVDQLRDRGVSLATVVITAHGDVPDAVRAIKGGAVDFLSKPFPDHVLLDRVQEAMKRDVEQHRQRRRFDVIHERVDRLTARERQVMERVVDGALNKQIAAELGLSHKTIEVHRAQVMRKMEADSLADLVKMSVAMKAAAQPAGA